MRPTGVSRAGRGKAARRLPSILHKVAELPLDLLQGTRPDVEVWTIPSQKCLARCLLAMCQPQCVHLRGNAAARVQSRRAGPRCSLGTFRGASAPGSGWFHGRGARSGRLPLRRRPRLVNSRLACGAIAGAQHGRCAAQRWHCKLKFFGARDPRSSVRTRACVGRVAAQCRIAEQHTQGGVLSTAGRWRTWTCAKLAHCTHAQVAPLHFLPPSCAVGVSGALRASTPQGHCAALLLQLPSTCLCDAISAGRAGADAVALQQLMLHVTQRSGRGAQ